MDQNHRATLSPGDNPPQLPVLPLERPNSNLVLVEGEYEREIEAAQHAIPGKYGPMGEGICRMDR